MLLAVCTCVNCERSLPNNLSLNFFGFVTRCYRAAVYSNPGFPSMANFSLFSTLYVLRFPSSFSSLYTQFTISLTRHPRATTVAVDHRWFGDRLDHDRVVSVVVVHRWQEPVVLRAERIRRLAADRVEGERRDRRLRATIFQPLDRNACEKSKSKNRNGQRSIGEIESNRHLFHRDSAADANFPFARRGGTTM